MFSCKTKGLQCGELQMIKEEEDSDEDGDDGEIDDDICDSDYEQFDDSSSLVLDNSRFYCELCDKNFAKLDLYNQHQSKHRTCGIDGCQFIGDDNIVEKHIENQHLTGLYDKIRKLNTPEDIEKWIEERRLKHPSNRENFKKRCEAEQERFKRGEKLTKTNERFNRNKTKFVKQCIKKRPKRQNKMTNPTQKERESLIDEKCTWNGNMFPFRGTGEIYIDDDNDQENCNGYSEIQENTAEMKNGLGAIMGAYLSDDDDIGDDDEPPVEIKIEKSFKIAEKSQIVADNSNIDNDDELIVEVKIERKLEIPEKSQIIANDSKKKPHKRRRNQLKQNNTNRSENNEFPNIKFVRRPLTLLEKLLEDEIRHERNVLLQCVQYVVENDFFRSDS